MVSLITNPPKNIAFKHLPIFQSQAPYSGTSVWWYQRTYPPPQCNMMSNISRKMANISQHRSRCLCNSVYMKGRRQPFGYPDICIAKKCLPCPARLKVGMLAFSNERWSQNSGNVGMLHDVTRLQLEMQQNKYNVITQSCLGAWNLTT